MSPLMNTSAIAPSQGPGALNPAGRVGREAVNGPSFRDALGQMLPTDAVPAAGMAPRQLPATLKFSSHAVDRMSARGISYTPEQMTRIERAIDKAASKGSKDTLVLTDDSALIVSVNNRTVVTVMDKSALKENVFTKIDSTVVI